LTTALYGWIINVKGYFAGGNMPIYEFRCTKCGQIFEEKRSFSESSAPATCLGCGSPAEKLVSVFASTAGFGVKVPDKEALRAPVKKKAPKKSSKRARG